jgi:dTDP-4-amino-4,6-dideoxygalactose transaminase
LVAQAFGDTTVSLPLSSKLVDGEIDYIIDVTRALLGR